MGHAGSTKEKGIRWVCSGSNAQTLRFENTDRNIQRENTPMFRRIYGERIEKYDGRDISLPFLRRAHPIKPDARVGKVMPAARRVRIRRGEKCYFMQNTRRVPRHSRRKTTRPTADSATTKRSDAFFFHLFFDLFDISTEITCELQNFLGAPFQSQPPVPPPLCEYHGRRREFQKREYKIIDQISSNCTRGCFPSNKLRTGKFTWA